MDYSYIFRGVSVAYVEQIETVPQALLEVHPTMMAAVPRFYEKIYANIVERGRRETGRRDSFSIGRCAWPRKPCLGAPMAERPSAAEDLAWKFADALVYSKIRSGPGRPIFAS